MCIQERFGGSVCVSIELSRGGPVSLAEGISLSVCRDVETISRRAFPLFPEASLLF